MTLDSVVGLVISVLLLAYLTYCDAQAGKVLEAH